MRFQDLGCGVWGSGFKVAWGVGFGVWGLGFSLSVTGLWIEGCGFRDGNCGSGIMIYTVPQAWPLH